MIIENKVTEQGDVLVIKPEIPIGTTYYVVHSEGGVIDVLYQCYP